MICIRIFLRKFEVLENVVKNVLSAWYIPSIKTKNMEKMKKKIVKTYTTK